MYHFTPSYFIPFKLATQFFSTIFNQYTFTESFRKDFAGRNNFIGVDSLNQILPKKILVVKPDTDFQYYIFSLVLVDWYHPHLYSYSPTLLQYRRDYSTNLVDIIHETVKIDNHQFCRRSIREIEKFTIINYADIIEYVHLF